MISCTILDFFSFFNYLFEGKREKEGENKKDGLKHWKCHDTSVIYLIRGRDKGDTRCVTAGHIVLINDKSRWSIVFAIE